MERSELVTIPGRWNFNYTYFAGETASRFFNELKTEARIMGTRCPRCRRVLVPARSFCDACYVATDEWVEIGHGGVLEVFTIVGVQFPGMPEPPFVIAYFTLDGADTALVNVLRGLDLSDLDEAAAILLRKPRVRVVFAPERAGRITDFHFELETAPAD